MHLHLLKPPRGFMYDLHNAKRKSVPAQLFLQSVLRVIVASLRTQYYDHLGHSGAKRMETTDWRGFSFVCLQYLTWYKIGPQRKDILLRIDNVCFLFGSDKAVASQTTATALLSHVSLFKRQKDWQLQMC